MDWKEVEIIYLISLLECNNVIIEQGGFKTSIQKVEEE